MGFALKKALGLVLMPLPLLLLVGAVGAVLWRRGRRRLGRGLVAGAAVLLLLASCRPLTYQALVRLETRHPPFPGDSVGAVVVLGGGHSLEPYLPSSAWLHPASTYRLVEGMRIARAQPWAEVVFSGYSGGGARPHAEVAAEVAEALGLEPDRVHLEPRPRDTAGEARILAPYLAGRRVALVMSASHMPRALALFRARGVDAVPAPTGHLARHAGLYWADVLPSHEALSQATVLWYELLGGLWARLRGQT